MPALPSIGRDHAVIAMIHLRALPGTPVHQGGIAPIVDAALQEARAYQGAGVDALMLENMHDTPYLRGAVGPEITAAMAVVCAAVKQATQLPCGVQVLAGANREALALALAAGLDFVRVEGFVFAHVGDEGLHQSCAAELLRYRRLIGADAIEVLADIKKKHSAHAITADVSLEETARAAELFRADAVVVTGAATGEPTSPAELDAVRCAVSLPVLVGSGVTLENLERYLGRADALIVGSHLKEGGHWANAVSAERAARFMDRVRELRG